VPNLKKVSLAKKKKKKSLALLFNLCRPLQKQFSPSINFRLGGPKLDQGCQILLGKICQNGGKICQITTALPFGH
jgi:hypothetical protein